jgi:hypothetical protein
MILVNYTITARCIRQGKAYLLERTANEMTGLSEWADLGFDNHKINRGAKTLG